MSSRLVREGGRLLVEITVPQPGLDVGTPYLALGNEPDTASRSWAFMGGTTARLGVASAVRGSGRGRVGVIPNDYPPGTCERALELRAEGLSCSQVAVKVGAPVSTVKFWAQRAKRAA